MAFPSEYNSSTASMTRYRSASGDLLRPVIRSLAKACIFVLVFPVAGTTLTKMARTLWMRIQPCSNTFSAIFGGAILRCSSTSPRSLMITQCIWLSSARQNILVSPSWRIGSRTSVIWLPSEFDTASISLVAAISSRHYRDTLILWMPTPSSISHMPWGVQRFLYVLELSPNIADTRSDAVQSATRLVTGYPPFSRMSRDCRWHALRRKCFSKRDSVTARPMSGSLGIHQVVPCNHNFDSQLCLRTVHASDIWSWQGCPFTPCRHWDYMQIYSVSFKSWYREQQTHKHSILLLYCIAFVQVAANNTCNSAEIIPATGFVDRSNQNASPSTHKSVAIGEWWQMVGHCIIIETSSPPFATLLLLSLLLFPRSQL